MKIVNILGGIGNQMFQYAFAIALREAIGADVYYDASVFETYPLHNGFELDRCFKVSLKQASPSEIEKLTYYTKSYFWWRVFKRLPRRKTQQYEPADGVFTPELLKDKRDMYYIGIWQDHKYFDKYKDIIAKELSWKEPLNARNQKVFDDFMAHDTVSLHIRRGDYLQNWRYKNICELDYYKRAIAYLKDAGYTDVQYAVFSNDISWCQENIVPLLGNAKITIVDWNQGSDSSNDMRLMQACKINVIANSSFSWWAAYLNCNEKPLVIAPEKWTNAEVHYKRQLDEWVLIEG